AADTPRPASNLPGSDILTTGGEFPTCRGYATLQHSLSAVNAVGRGHMLNPRRKPMPSSPRRTSARARPRKVRATAALSALLLATVGFGPPGAAAPPGGDASTATGHHT